MRIPDESVAHFSEVQSEAVMIRCLSSVDFHDWFGLDNDIGDLELSLQIRLLNILVHA